MNHEFIPADESPDECILCYRSYDDHLYSEVTGITDEDEKPDWVSMGLERINTGW